MIGQDCSAVEQGSQGTHYGRFLLGLVVCLSWALLGFGPPVLTSGGTPPDWRLDPGQVQALVTAGRMPQVTARAALLADAKTGQILLNQNGDQPLPPASTTKVMTALVVLERTRPDDPVTVPASALIGEASMGLLAGERLSVGDLLYGLLTVSGNDAAMALAGHVAGTPDAFVVLMNQRAAAMNLAATHFANPHGLDAPNHVMSASDLLTITRAALTHDLFAQIVATPKSSVAGHLLVSTNELLTTYPGADGVKTGTTDAGGECLVASATRDGQKAIAIVLGSRDRYGDSRALLDHYFAYYGWLRLGLPHNGLSRQRWPDGRVRELVAEAEPAVFLPRWQWPLVRTAIVINRDGADDAPAGKAIYRLGTRMLAETSLRWRDP